MKRKRVLFDPHEREINALGKRIKEARLRRRFSMKQVCERAGITRPTLSKIENPNGDASVCFGHLVEVLRVLGLASDLSLIAKEDKLGRSIQDNALHQAKRAPRKKNKHMRLIAIGDIHGHREKLDNLLHQIQPREEDRFVFLGDYIDRGPDSRGVIEDLIDFRLLYPKTIFLRGNHEQLLIDTLISCRVIEGTPLHKISPEWRKDVKYETDAMLFVKNGGDKTLKNYDAEVVRDGFKHTLIGTLPQSHIGFLTDTKLYYEYGDFLFVHANTDPLNPLEENDPFAFLWDRPTQYREGKTLIAGHTPTEEGYTPDIGSGVVRLDTGAAYGGPLSAMDIFSGQMWRSQTG
jgi:serine/threonine protein phosphatase 1